MYNLNAGHQLLHGLEQHWAWWCCAFFAYTYVPAGLERFVYLFGIHAPEDSVSVEQRHISGDTHLFARGFTLSSSHN
jgi:hypothetical protein